MSDRGSPIPGRDGGIVLVVLTLIGALVLLIIGWSGARWEAALRDSVVPLDRLAQSRQYVTQAELFAERLVHGDPTSSPELVLATLERALHAGHAVVEDGVRLGALVTAQPGSPALQAVVGDYLRVLEGTAASVRARMSSPDEISGSELRLLHAALREASARVETVLLADVQRRYRVQREVQQLAIVLVAALLLIVIAFRYHAMKRRREAVVRVVESEERLRAFVSAMPEVALMLDRDGRYLEVFGTSTGLLYSPERLRGASVFDVFPSAIAQSFVDVIRQAIAGRGVLSHEYELEIDGSVHSFEARVSPVGDLGQVVWLSRDVTERRRAEERSRLHSVALEGTRDGIMVTDAQGRILSVNPALGAITGYHGDELVGATPQVLRSNRDDVAFFRNLWALLQRDGHWQGELWIRRKNGDVAPQWVSISAVTDAAGNVAQYVAIYTDISQLRQFEERVAYLARHDALTDLPNRVLMGVHLEHAIESARREGVMAAVLLLDLDRFKNVNDALGHEAGDELLAAVALRLAHRLRRDDILGRHGGDEYLAVLGLLREPNDAAVVARDLLAALEQPFVLRGGYELYINASIGISLFPGDAQSAAELIKNADAAMYQAKRRGRNTFSFYRAELTRLANTRLALESRLRRALEEQRFEMYYQPLVGLGDGRILGAEALVRLRADDGGVPIGPAEFIPVMEESGLIVELGRWVQREVCRQGREWLDEGLRFELLAVNLSAEEVRRGGVVEQLRAALEETGFPPELLELEITESGLMQRGDEALAFLHELKALGVRLSIDDFGTGYSSLSYLKRFPVNKLKIDRGFIRDIPSDQNDVQLTATIIELARGLGLKVLAEGVESAAQRDFLAAYGCDAYQGYLCSPPVPAEAFRARFLLGAGQGVRAE